MRRYACRFVFGLAALLVASTSARTALASEPTDCPGVIQTGPASYQLTADIDACWLTPDGVGALPAITIDLAGHTWSNSFISLTRDGSRLTDGTFDHSTVWLAGTLDHVTMRNGISFSLEAFGLLTITDSTFESNQIGLSAYFGSAAVEDSTFRDNDLGVVIGRGSGSSVEASQFEGNGQGVFLWDEDLAGSDDVSVQHNSFIGNGMGIVVRAVTAVQRARISGNQLDENDGAAIDVSVICDAGPFCGGLDMSIERNHLRRNGFAAATPADGDGIHVRGEMNVTGEPVDPAWITLSANQSDRNAALGIDAPGVTDGGRNRAKFNGDPRQCVGVDCGGRFGKHAAKKKHKLRTLAQPALQVAPQAASEPDSLASLLAELPRH